MFDSKRRTDRWAWRPLCLVLTSIVFAAPAVSAAEGWELHTAEDAVPGTQEIESGQAASGIRLAEAFLQRADLQQKVAVLTNLCIGHMLLGNFAKAKPYCDDAASMPNERTVTYNNRGVLNALEGHFTAAIQDFNTAIESGCLGECSSPENTPRDLPRPTARRNLVRVERTIAAREEPDRKPRVTADAD